MSIHNILFCGRVKKDVASKKNINLKKMYAVVAH